MVGAELEAQLAQARESERDLVEALQLIALAPLYHGDEALDFILATARAALTKVCIHEFADPPYSDVRKF